MRITYLSKVNGFAPPGHVGVEAFLLRASGQDGRLTLVRSVFSPGGETEYAAPSQGGGTETIYYILDGELTFTTNTETALLRPGDSVLCEPGDSVHIRNQTNLPAAVLILLGG